MNKAKSLADMRGFARTWGARAMDDYIAYADLDSGRSIHIASLARQTIIDAGASHMGFDGYFIFEVDDRVPHHPLQVLAKAASLESAFRIADLWAERVAA